MAYAEKRDGKLTGLWYGEVTLKAHGRFKRTCAGEQPDLQRPKS